MILGPLKVSLPPPPLQVVVIGACVLAVLTAVTLSSAQYYGTRTTTANGTPLLSAEPPPRFDKVLVAGRTALPAHVQLYAGSTLAAATTSTLSARDRGNKRGSTTDQKRQTEYPYAFSFSLSDIAGFFNEGSYVAVLATAYDAPFTVRELWSSVIPPATTHARAPSVLTRDVSVTMSSDRIRYHARLVFARDDPLIRLFLNRELDGERLLARTLPIEVNYVLLPSVAVPSSMRVQLAADTITVSVNGDTAHVNRPVLVQQEFGVIRGSIVGEPRVNDTLRLRMNEYRIDSSDPLPVRSG